MPNIDLMGINEERINNLVLEIYDSAEKINIILNSILANINEINDNFITNGVGILEKKIPKIKDSFTIARDNVLSYADEFLNAKKDYIKISEDMASFVNKSIKEIKIENNKEEV